MNDSIVASAIVEKIKDAIVEYIKRSDHPVKPSELASWLGVELSIVQKLCSELIKEGSLGTKQKERK